MTPDSKRPGKKLLHWLRLKLASLNPKADLASRKAIDLEPEDLIALYDLQPDEIPPKIQEGFQGIPKHIEVLNEVHLENGTPEEFYNKGHDQQQGSD